MKMFSGFIGMVLLAGMALPVQAGVDGNAVVGGALGGAAGAAIGSAVGGRDGAIIGGAIGGATGTAVLTSNRREPSVRREVVYVDEHEHHDNGRHRGQYKHRHGGDRNDD